ncbi:MAG: PDZ domain-containing protein [Candidatus Aminicenantes bacterium]|nr:MAG: PDZ domain-containing protein [Candidatus Aminicenantes bacterium]
MKRSLIIFLLFILLTTHFTMGIAPPPENTISFKWQGHLIVVEGNINSSQDNYNFIIDTGALTFIDKNVAQELQLKQKGMMAKINSLELSGFYINDIFCFTTFDFQHFNAIGIPIHGIIGPNLLERYKVAFDFKSCSVTFSSDTTSLDRPENALFLTFRNHPVNNAPLVNFKMGDKSIEGMIDTGQPYPIVFPLESFEKYKNLYVSDFIKSRGLMEEWPDTTADFNYLARLKSFELENIKVESIVCLFGQLPRPLSMPLIGNNFLSQFKIVINYPKDEMLMLPYYDIHFKNNRFSVGLNPGISKENEIIIKGVWENSPADNAKIEVGDIIISFNSEKATQTNLIELINMMKDDTKESIILEIKNQDTTRKIKLNKAILF